MSIRRCKRGVIKWLIRDGGDNKKEKKVLKLLERVMEGSKIVKKMKNYF